MKNTTSLFRIFNIDIKLHYSWYLIFVLLAWSLATAFFPQQLPNHSLSLYWVMGIVSSLLLFLSVLLHELSHSLVAKAKRIKVESITLFFFGGVAGISDEEMKPSTEFLMALAGPLFSLLLAGIFYLFFKQNISAVLNVVLFYLAQINLLLALFNLLPGFPLDGGRAFRAILYGYYQDIKKATRIATFGGKVLGGFLIFLGLLGIWQGLGNGLWFIFLGGFLFFLAGVSYEQVVVREILKLIPLKEVAKKRFMILPAHLTFSDFLKRYALAEEEAFVVKRKNFRGVINTPILRTLSPAQQKVITLGQLALPLSKIKTLSLKDNAYFAFKLLNEQNLNILPVVEKGKIIAIVTRRSLTHRLLWGLRYSSVLKKN